jgi:hypothetical protein
MLLSCKTTSSVQIMASGTIAATNYSDTIAFNFDYNLPLIAVEIEGETYNFLLDTGAPSVIPPELFEKLQLKGKSSTKISDSNNTSNTEILTQVPKMKIGNLTYENIGVFVIDLKQSYALKCFKLDGIIGANQMAKSYWRLDYENKLCIISSEFQQSTVQDFEIVNFIPKRGQLTPLVNLEIESIMFNQVTFDTGYNGAISLPYEKKLDSIFQRKVVNYGSESAGVYGLGTTKDIYETEVSMTKMDALELQNQMVSFSEDPSMTIGNEVFKYYTIVFDWQTRKMFFKRNNLEQKSNELLSFGFSFMKIQNTIQIVRLIKNSEAEKLGMKIGDELISINETKMHDLTDEKLCDYLFFGFKKFKLGETINVKIKRNNEELNFKLTRENFLN